LIPAEKSGGFAAEPYLHKSFCYSFKRATKFGRESQQKNRQAFASPKYEMELNEEFQLGGNQS